MIRRGLIVAATLLLGLCLLAAAVWLLGEILFGWFAVMCLCWFFGVGATRSVEWLIVTWRRSWDWNL